MPFYFTMLLCFADWKMWFWNCGGWRYQARRICNRVCGRRWPLQSLFSLCMPSLSSLFYCFRSRLINAVSSDAVIDDKTCEERLWNMKHRGETNFYLCEINRDMVIDASYKGNKSRYINHSCCPNTEMQKWFSTDP